jgi:hypothetical protein
MWLNRKITEYEDEYEREHKVVVLVLVLENQTINFAERTDMHPLPHHLITAKLDKVNTRHRNSRI